MCFCCVAPSVDFCKVPPFVIRYHLHIRPVNFVSGYFCFCPRCGSQGSISKAIHDDTVQARHTSVVLLAFFVYFVHLGQNIQCQRFISN